MDRQRTTKLAGCTKCPRLFEKFDRSHLRRSLRRHLALEHDVDPAAAMAEAWRIVPRADKELSKR